MASTEADKTLDADRESSRSVSPFRAGLKCRCPHCHEGALFDGVLVLAKSCNACGADFTKADPGDGAIIFVILILGAMLAVLAFLSHGIFAPPILFHAIVWPIFACFMGLWMLRVFKATLIALQFQYDAKEASLVDAEKSND
jgi:uncharacterized protein (DUF983 family)